MQYICVSGTQIHFTFQLLDESKQINFRDYTDVSNKTKMKQITALCGFTYVPEKKALCYDEIQ